MHDYLYLPTLVSDRRSARIASAERHRLLAGLRFSRTSRHPTATLTLAASADRTSTDATAPRAA